MREIDMPTFLYGTAWKEEKTESLTYQALEMGFTGIDTANQRKHYYEEGVGRAIKRFLESEHLSNADVRWSHESLGIPLNRPPGTFFPTGGEGWDEGVRFMGNGINKRARLFIQTKFTFARGQDHRKPYDPRASYAIQVRQSFESSLQHLGLDYIDSYILHGPFTGYGLTEEDWETWEAMEHLQKSGAVKSLGVSNFSLAQLQELHRRAKLKPAFIQNRCFAAWGWDKAIRAFCKASHIQYQGFSILTANRSELSHPNIALLSKKYKRTIPQIVFRFARQAGMIPLTGTSNRQHMQEDLDLDDFELTPDEVAQIEKIGLD